MFASITARLRALRSLDPIVAILLLIALGVFISQCVAGDDPRFDDAYITFSFAKNLALGHGPVYSHGVRVEGYSAFLWMLLLSPGLTITAGSAPLSIARIVGAPFLVLLGWSLYRLAQVLGAHKRTAAGAVLLLSFSTDLAVAYMSGMETAAYVAVVGFGLAVTASSFRDARFIRVVPWAGLAILMMRIDGFVPCAFLLACSCLRELRTEPRSALLRVARQWGPPLLIYAVYFGWRWSYYGLPLPSPYYAKALIPKVLPKRGFDYVWREVMGSWLWLGLLGGGWLSLRRQLLGALCAGFALLGLWYVVRVGGDWMPFARFVLPLVPLLIALFVAASSDLVELTRGAQMPLRQLGIVIPLGLAAGMLVRFDHRFANNNFEDKKVERVQVQREKVRDYQKAARFLRQVVPAGARLVTDSGGVLAFYTDAAIIEMWGIANATIATQGNTHAINPVYGKACPGCYAELDPEYFHVVEPLVRTEPAFEMAEAVINQVRQHARIERFINFRERFAVGRVARRATNEALYFLQKRVEGKPLTSRRGEKGYVIDYPFERWRSMVFRHSAQQ